MMRKYLLGLVLAATTLFAPVTVIAQTDSRTISTAGANCSVATNCAIFGVQGYPSIGIYLNVAASGTFEFEATTGEIPATATWFGITDDVGGGSNATADGALFFTNPGYTYIRLRASAISGDATAVAARGFGGLRSTATLAGEAQGDGAILDGTNGAIEATVLDLTSANPLTVAILDSNGDQITSFGGGTQYAVDAALGAAPTGTLAIAIRDDALAALTPIEGDAVGLRVSSTGALWVTSDSLSTAANQTTIIGHVDGLEGLLTTIDTDTGNIATSVSNIDTDTSTIITAVQLIDNLVLAEDAVHGSGDPGVQMLAIRQNSQVDLAADGDYLPLTVDDSGGLRVTIVAGAGSGGTAVADDADFTAGTTSFTPMGGFYQSTVTACTDGDTCAMGLTAQRAAKVTLYSEAGTALTVGTDYAEDDAHASGDSGPAILTRRSDAASTTAGTDGDYALLNTDGSGRLWVNCGTGCSGGTQYAVDAVAGAGDTGTLALVVRDDALATLTPADGDYSQLRVDSTGRLWTIAAQSGTWTVNLGATDNAVLDDIADGIAVTNAGTFAVQSVEAAGALLTAAQNADTDLTSIIGHLAASTQHYRTSAGATEDEFEVKATAGVLTGGIITNTAATVSYLKCSNLTAANTTPGTSAVFFAAAIPGATTGAGFTLPVPPGGVTFSTALTCYLVKGAADTDVAEVGANEVKVNLFYR